MAGYIAIIEDTCGFAPDAVIIPNLLSCGALLLQLQNGYAAAHLAAGVDFSQMPAEMRAHGVCLRDNVIAAPGQPANPVQRAYLYVAQNWYQFLSSAAGVASINQMKADLGIDLITIVPDKADTSVGVRLLPDVGGSWIATRQGYGPLPNDGLKMNNFLMFKILRQNLGNPDPATWYRPILPGMPQATQISVAVATTPEWVLQNW